MLLNALGVCSISVGGTIRLFCKSSESARSLSKDNPIPQQSLRVQVPACEASAVNHTCDSQCRNSTYSVAGYFGPLGSLSWNTFPVWGAHRTCARWPARKGCHGESDGICCTFRLLYGEPT